MDGGIGREKKVVRKEKWRKREGKGSLAFNIGHIKKYIVIDSKKPIFESFFLYPVS